VGSYAGSVFVRIAEVCLLNSVLFCAGLNTCFSSETPPRRSSDESLEAVHQKNMTTFSDEFLSLLKQKAEDYSYGLNGKQRNLRLALDAEKKIIAGDFCIAREIGNIEKQTKDDSTTDLSARIDSFVSCIFVDGDIFEYTKRIILQYRIIEDKILENLWKCILNKLVLTPY
jgi:hypothetical protein